MRQLVHLGVAAALAIAGTGVTAVQSGAATSSCRVESRALANPLPPIGGNGLGRYVELSATNDRGTWAGVAFDGTNEFGLLRYRSGGRLTVLARFHERGTYDINADPTPSVSIAGVTRNGVIIFGRQTGRRLNRYTPYRVAHRKLVPMRTRPGWISAVPTSVGANGSSVGVARTGHGGFVVRWTPTGRNVRVLARTRYLSGAGAYLDAANEVAYTTRLPGGRLAAYVRKPDGSRVKLVGARGRDVEPIVLAAAGVTFFGIKENNFTQTRIATWQPQGSTGPSVRGRDLDRLQQLSTVGVAGSFAGWRGDEQRNNRELFHPASGTDHRMPRQLSPEGGPGGTLPNAIARGRVISFTGPAGRVRFLSCP